MLYGWESNGRPRIEIRKKAQIISEKKREKKKKRDLSSRTGLRVSALGVEYHFRAVDELPLVDIPRDTGAAKSEGNATSAVFDHMTLR